MGFGTMMRRAISNYRWITAVFCLITMLSAFVVIGGSTQKLVETSEQIELEECKELIQVRRQRVNRRNGDDFAYPVSLQSDSANQLLSGTACLFPNHQRQHLNGCGSYLRI